VAIHVTIFFIKRKRADLIKHSALWIALPWCHKKDGIHLNVVDLQMGDKHRCSPLQTSHHIQTLHFIVEVPQ
jgi:hypothetical protein